MSGEWGQHKAPRSVSVLTPFARHGLPRQTGDGRSATPLFNCQFLFGSLSRWVTARRHFVTSPLEAANPLGRLTGLRTSAGATSDRLLVPSGGRGAGTL